MLLNKEHYIKRSLLNRTNLETFQPYVAQSNVSYRSSHQRCSIIKGVPRNFEKFTGKQLCQSLFLYFIKKETLAQVFSCESCKISKNTFFTEHLRTTASIANIIEIKQNTYLADLHFT